MANIRERALDPRVAPCRIVRCHPLDELTDLEQNAAPSGSRGVRPFPGYQLPMPAQQGVRRRDRGDLPQDRTADSVCSGGQPPAIVVRETQSTSAKLTAQEPVLFHEVGDGLPLPAVQPTGQHTEHHMQRPEVDHEPELISWLAQRTSADLWNTTSTPARFWIYG